MKFYHWNNNPLRAHARFLAFDIVSAVLWDISIWISSECTRILTFTASFFGIAGISASVTDRSSGFWTISLLRMVHKYFVWISFGFKTINPVEPIDRWCSGGTITTFQNEPLRVGRRTSSFFSSILALLGASFLSKYYRIQSLHNRHRYLKSLCVEIAFRDCCTRGD